MTPNDKDVEQQSCINEDKEIYRVPAKDIYEEGYTPTLRVTKEGALGIQVGGMVYVKPIKDWFELAKVGQPSLVPLTEQEEERLCDFYLALGEVKYKDDDLLKEFETFVKPLFSKFGYRPVIKNGVTTTNENIKWYQGVCCSGFPNCIHKPILSSSPLASPPENANTWDAPMVLTPILDFEETNAKETGSTEVEPTVGKKSVSREVIEEIIKKNGFYGGITTEKYMVILPSVIADAILKAMEGKT